jgi:hypothetical protein
MPPVRVHSPRAFHTRYVPPSGFFTLLTASSSVGLPGLLSCRSAHGVPHPSEPFPRPEPERLSAPVALLPFTALAARPHATSGVRRQLRQAGASRARPDFRALLPGSSPLPLHRGLDRRRARCSPGFSASSPGLSPTSRPAVYPPPDPPPSFWSQQQVPEHPHAVTRLPGVERYVAGRTPAGERQTLMRFAYLVDVLPSEGSALPWLMGSPRG